MTHQYEVDRSTWKSGPWDQEPDFLLWVDKTTGLDCAILRHGLFGHLCGYVGVPRGHALWGDKGWHELDVHGGVTFTERELPDPRSLIEKLADAENDKARWWIGFDCNHSCDRAPFDPIDAVAAKLPPHLAQLAALTTLGDRSYRTFGYVKAEVESLARQLAS